MEPQRIWPGVDGSRPPSQDVWASPSDVDTVAVASVRGVRRPQARQTSSKGVKIRPMKSGLGRKPSANKPDFLYATQTPRCLITLSVARTLYGVLPQVLIRSHDSPSVRARIGWAGSRIPPSCIIKPAVYADIPEFRVGNSGMPEIIRVFCAPRCSG